MPRFLHRIYAAVMGYFWLPCPLCGEFFGGHESKTFEGIPVAGRPRIKQLICDSCSTRSVEALDEHKAQEDGPDE